MNRRDFFHTIGISTLALFFAKQLGITKKPEMIQLVRDACKKQADFMVHTMKPIGKLDWIIQDKKKVFARISCTNKAWKEMIEPVLKMYPHHFSD